LVISCAISRARRLSSDRTRNPLKPAGAMILLHPSLEASVTGSIRHWKHPSLEAADGKTL
jgi:hypothetical protein